MINFAKITALGTVALMLATTVAAEAAPNRVKTRGQNGVATVATGANGSIARARGARMNSDGSVTAGSGGAFKTATGEGARASTTTINPDGSATRSGRFAASGAKGSASSSSDVTRNADGTYSGGRTSTATSTATGNTFNGSTQIDPATGKPVRTSTCTNASGAVIACPR
jgi:hypothetical protein